MRGFFANFAGSPRQERDGGRNDDMNKEQTTDNTTPGKGARKARTIAIVNHKGGVGKTTSTASLGTALGRMGLRTLVIDLDAQQNLTFSLTERASDGSETLAQCPDTPSIFDALMGRCGLPQLKVGKNLWMTPSSLELAGAETLLSTRMAREGILRGLIEAVADKYDYVLLDCPPSLGLVTVNALSAADGILIPLTAETLPLRGMTMLDDIVRQVRQSINPRLRLQGVFITRYNNRRLNNAVTEAVRARYGSLLMNTRIRENISLAETPASGHSIFEYAPDSNGASDYNALAREFLANDRALE